jgi:chromosome segregation protein
VNAIAKAREKRETKREAMADVRLELAEKKQRLETLDRSLGEVQRESADLQDRILRRNQEIDTLNEQIQPIKRHRQAELEKSAELTPHP